MNDDLKKQILDIVQFAKEAKEKAFSDDSLGYSYLAGFCMSALENIEFRVQND